ncbi:hypothetical protein ACIOJD_33615 [Streptomyces sp. NPDC088116]|uniref:hypothetical protein n=1 Tax=Streptomyces sp. NPDC088116 TaxID=3365825 RepID=UPI00380C136A
MTSTIDDLLARASVPTSDPRTFDVAGALCRLAADAARVSSPPEIERATQAGHMLGVVSRWAINAPDAAVHMAKVVEDPDTDDLLTLEPMDANGAMVFACLLYLTGHPQSAQFWWQFAAGAESRAAAYCLHLHHRHLQELREAWHWYQQATTPQTPYPDHWDPLDEEFIGGLEAVARYVRRHGSGASAPTGGLEGEVDRLASRKISPAPAIVRRPDRRLADQLHRFTTRHR